MTRDDEEEIEAAFTVTRLVSVEELIAGHKEDGRAVYRREAKATLIAAATKPGASVARIARAHDINANQLHLWIRQSKRKGLLIGKAGKVGVGMEKAAIARRASVKQMIEATHSPTPAKLLPVTLSPSSAASTTSSAMPSPRQPSAVPNALVIEIGDARIHIEGRLDQRMLCEVIACLRGAAPIAR
jgi:transposase-like protein